MVNERLERALDCAGKRHCLACRSSESFRAGLVAAKLVDERDFQCRFGITAATADAARFDQSLWPVWARAVAAFRAPTDTGIGDTFERHFGKAGIFFKAWIKEGFGIDCGCDERKAGLNQTYPFKP